MLRTVRKRSPSSAPWSVSARTYSISASSTPLQCDRLSAGSPETSAERSVAPVKARTGRHSGHCCARRTAGSRSLQIHTTVSAVSAVSDREIDSPRPTARAASRTRRSASTSVGVPIEEDPPHRERDDLEVEPERPVLDVLEVELDALLERGVAPQPVDLRPAGHAGLHLVPQHVAGDGPAELLDEEWALRSGTDDAHLAAQDVHELGQLVEAEPAQDRAERHATRIVRGCPHRPAPRLRIDAHGAQLEHAEPLAVEPHPLLPVEHRPARREL